MEAAVQILDRKFSDLKEECTKLHALGAKEIGKIRSYNQKIGLLIVGIFVYFQPFNDQLRIKLYQLVTLLAGFSIGLVMPVFIGYNMIVMFSRRPGQTSSARQLKREFTKLKQDVAIIIAGVEGRQGENMRGLNLPEIDDKINQLTIFRRRHIHLLLLEARNGILLIAIALLTITLVYQWIIYGKKS